MAGAVLTSWFIFLAWPSGVALQSMALGIGLLYGICRRKELSSSAEWRFVAVSYLFFLLLRVASSLLNGRESPLSIIEDFIGYSSLVVIPPMLCLLWQKVPASERYRQAFIALTLVTLVSLSQMVWQWRMEGMSIETGPEFARARGFYSHPLTLAYAALMLWPFWLNRGVKYQSWWGGLCVVGILIATVSRGVLAVAVAVAGIVFFFGLRGKARSLALACGIAVLGITAVTENRVSKQFSQLFSERNPDRASPYLDDRFAFWHAFSEMIQERPLLGHGSEIDRAYRKTYYKKIGLENFQKQYEAHNQYLQIAAETGLLGLLVFLCFILAIYRFIRSLPVEAKQIGLLTLLCFLISGLTQNAFQDSEVRYGLTVLLSLGLAVKKSQPGASLEP